MFVIGLEAANKGHFWTLSRVARAEFLTLKVKKGLSRSTVPHLGLEHPDPASIHQCIN